MLYYPAPNPDAKRARVFTRHDFLHSLKVASITRQPERNQLLICMSHGCGLRVTELSQITIGDVMFSTNQIREELTLRAAITKRSKSRTVPFTNTLLLAKLEAYLQYRIANDIGMELNTKTYRGLSPHLPLIYSDRNTPFQLSLKARKSKSGEVVSYWACDTLERTFSKLYAQSGLKGASSHSGRRTFGSKIMETTGDIELVARWLGHDSIEQSSIYIEPNIKALRAALSSFVDGVDVN
ncbi:MAG: site-specific integrase [bacterium]|nr:site-specific integrase [bacterium]